MVAVTSDRSEYDKILNDFSLLDRVPVWIELETVTRVCNDLMLADITRLPRIAAAVWRYVFIFVINLNQKLLDNKILIKLIDPDLLDKIHALYRKLCWHDHLSASQPVLERSTKLLAIFRRKAITIRYFLEYLQHHLTETVVLSGCCCFRGKTLEQFLLGLQIQELNRHTSDLGDFLATCIVAINQFDYELVSLLTATQNRTASSTALMTASADRATSVESIE